MQIGQRVRFYNGNFNDEGIVIDILYEGNKVLAVYVEDKDKELHRATLIYDLHGTRIYPYGA